jgi:hypothetical protein
MDYITYGHMLSLLGVHFKYRLEINHVSFVVSETVITASAARTSRGATLTTQPHLVPRSRMSRSCISSPPKRLLGV